MPNLSPGHLAQLACIAEVTAPKAGNVHLRASFQDASWDQFVASAALCAPLLDQTRAHGVGPTILACVQTTRRSVGTNTNLGILLLLAPLCAVDPSASLEAGIGPVLDGFDDGDAAAVYQAIELANPGGLGRLNEADVRRRPPIGLIEAMRQAADRDAVARQYTSGFDCVLHRIAPVLRQSDLPLDQAVVYSHLDQMAREPDSLIGRKCTAQIAGQAQRSARACLAAGGPATPTGRALFVQLDRWLRADGNLRNPGTSADLVTAGLFAALRQGWITYPFRWSGSLLDRPDDPEGPVDVP